jgi:predicted RND superfamily exporter protein
MAQQISLDHKRGIAMRERIFDFLAKAAEKRPWLVMLAALLITVVAVGLSSRLRIETQFLSLVPRDDPAAVEFDEIIRQYASASQVVVGIEGEDKEQMVAFAHALEKRAHEAMYSDRKSGQKKRYVKRIMVRKDMDFIESHGWKALWRSAVSPTKSPAASRG